MFASSSDFLQRRTICVKVELLKGIHACIALAGDSRLRLLHGQGTGQAQAICAVVEDTQSPVSVAKLLVELFQSISALPLLAVSGWFKHRQGLLDRLFHPIC